MIGIGQAKPRLRQQPDRCGIAGMHRRPQRIDHPGYWDSDAFYEGIGNFNAVRTCNQWVNAKLRIAGVEASLWTPFSKGVTWRHPLPEDQST